MSTRVVSLAGSQFFVFQHIVTEIHNHGMEAKRFCCEVLTGIARKQVTGLRGSND